MCSRHRQLATFIEYNGTYFIAVFSLPTIHIQESCPSFYPSPIHHPPSPISHIYLPLPFCKLTHGSSPPILLSLPPPPLPLPNLHSLTPPNHTPFTTDFLLTTRPLEPACKSIVLHQSPRVSAYIRVEILPDFVLGVDFSLAWMVDARCRGVGGGVFGATVSALGLCFSLLWTRGFGGSVSGW
jgi:hypothetical protein